MTERSQSGGRAARGLIGFYASCTVFGVAVTVSAVSWIVFPGAADGLGYAGLVIALVAAVATWHFLGVMRRER